MDDLKKTRDNPIPHLSEFDIDLTSQEGGKYSARASLRIHCEEVQIRETTYVCGFHTAFIHSELEGLEIEPGTKFAEQMAVGPSEQAEAGTRRSKNLGLKLGSASQSLISIAGGTEFQSDRSNVASYTTHHLAIRGRPNNAWELISNNPVDKDSMLDFTYMDNEVLCILKNTGGANRRRARFSVVAKRRHFAVREGDVADSRPLRGRKATINKERVIGILLAKSVSGASRTPERSEVIVTSSVRFEDE